ncbi:MAG: phosphatidate cytidylyltransferase [Spirochaetaceae bacterium]|jgi:phosphatidate cytidylyltransferase|nr:phosphatidate cytidylyltransferase [Spirochaetaceae bacterium]
MNKVLARLGVFFIGFPLCLAIVIFLPQYNHLAANLLVCAVSGAASIEFAAILRKRNFNVKNAEAVLLGVLPPLLVTAHVSFGVSFMAPLLVFTAAAAWVFVSHILVKKKEEIENIIPKAAGLCAVLFYPSFFLCWMIMINGFLFFPHLFGFYLSLVIITDSFGWFFGVLFGKNSGGLIAISPNKSVAGYLGGIAGSVALSLCASHFFPGLFEPSKLSPAVSAVIIALVTTIASSAGDLAESALKRSASVKDSGDIIPGRGGALDSVDSLAFAAPFFYFCLIILYN